MQRKTRRILAVSTTGGRAHVEVDDLGQRAEDPRRKDRELTVVFDRLFATASPFGSLAERAWHPFTDIFESDDRVYIRMELAGIDPESLEVAKEGRCLVVRGQRPDPFAARALACQQLEVSHGPFERVVRLTTDFSEDDVCADYGRSTGFLEITIKKERR